METALSRPFQHAGDPALLEISARRTIWSLPLELRDLVEADPDAMPELVSIFLNDATVRLQALGSACVNQDFKVVRAQAHSLKGAALQMGAGSLGSLCAALEASDKPQPDRSTPMMRSILDEFALVRQAMEKYLTGENDLT